MFGGKYLEYSLCLQSYAHYHSGRFLKKHGNTKKKKKENKP